MSTTSEAARAAATRIAPHVRRTPLEHAPFLSELTGADVWLKLECHQVTGSFKARGALAKLTALSEAERRKGVVTASSGNHGAAVAYGLARLGMTGVVYVPETASPAKVSRIRALGAEVRFHGDDSGLSEQEARRVAAAQGVPYVSPYNDPDVVAGQGTIALEILEQLPEPPDAVVAAVGGGGLIAGIAAVLKAQAKPPRVVGASPAVNCAMAKAMQEGRIVPIEPTPTLSDGTAGGLDDDAITLAACRTLVDEMVLVSEESIAQAMRWLIGNQSVLVEGAAAVPLAALFQERERYRGKRVVLVLCGANVSLDVLRRVLAEGAGA